MFSPARLTQVTVEMIFVLLGVLVIWLGLHGRINFNPFSVTWMALSIGMVIWGGLALAKPGPWSERWQRWNRGSSMIVLGVLMLTIGRVPFIWVGKFLALCGLVLIIRGIVGSLLIFKQP